MYAGEGSILLDDDFRCIHGSLCGADMRFELLEEERPHGRVARRRLHAALGGRDSRLSIRPSSVQHSVRAQRGSEWGATHSGAEATRTRWS